MAISTGICDRAIGQAGVRRGSIGRAGQGRAGGAHLAQLDALLVLLLLLFAQRRRLAEHGLLQHVAPLPLLSHLVQACSNSRSLAVELLLADAVEKLRSLSTGIALLLRSAAPHACRARGRGCGGQPPCRHKQIGCAFGRVISRARPYLHAGCTYNVLLVLYNVRLGR